MKTVTILVALFLAGCEPDPELGEVVKIERKNSRTCNYSVVPVSNRLDTLIIQNHCERWEIGQIIEIPGQ